MDDGTKDILVGVDKKLAAAILDESKVVDFYRSLVTKIDQAALELESLIILGVVKHTDMDHYIDADLREKLYEIMTKINRRRLQREHGVEKNVDNVSFLEEHPLFRSKKSLDTD